MGLFSVCRGQKRVEEAEEPQAAELIGPDSVLIERYFNEEELRHYEALLADEEQRKSEVLAPKRWQAGEFLGQGSFGRVIFAANMDTGELFAVKQIPISGFSYETVHERVEEIQQEVDILSHLNHKNIVRYMGSSRDEQNLNIFLEYVAGGSIASLLGKYGKFNESLVRVYTRQIVEGLEYLHFHNIIHRDIKGANVLVNNEGVCKLADFGAAKKIYGLTDYTQFKSLRGTINWMAPEVIKQEGHGRYADIWSLGCTVLEMLTAKPPWHHKTNPVSAT